MERRIDLSNLDIDRAADLIAERQPRWSERGLAIDPLTWMDNDQPWPARLLTDRTKVRRPLSLGVHIHGDDAEAQIVLYAGGWADADYYTASIDEMIAEYVELEDADEFGPLLDRIAARLTIDTL